MCGASSAENLRSLIQRVMNEYAELMKETATSKENVLQVIVCTEAAKGIIGKKGEIICGIKQETGCHLQVEKRKVDLGNNITEQAVTITVHTFYTTKHTKYYLTKNKFRNLQLSIIEIEVLSLFFAF